MKVTSSSRRVIGAATALLFTSTLGAQAPALSLADAKKALDAAEQAALTSKVPPMTCSVVDARGDLVAVRRMDGAGFVGVNFSYGKARVAALFNAASGSLANMASYGVQQAAGEPLFFLQGAVPIARDGKTIGAIGCGGGSGVQDENVAKAGLAAL